MGAAENQAQSDGDIMDVDVPTTTVSEVHPRVRRLTSSEADAI